LEKEILLHSILLKIINEQEKDCIKNISIDEIAGDRRKVKVRKGNNEI